MNFGDMFYVSFYWTSEGVACARQTYRRYFRRQYLSVDHDVR